MYLTNECRVAVTASSGLLAAARSKRNIGLDVRAGVTAESFRHGLSGSRLSCHVQAKFRFQPRPISPSWL